MENTTTTETMNPATDAAAAEPAKKLKSLKFLYVGLAWAFGYPSMACLIGYGVYLTSGSPAIA